MDDHPTDRAEYASGFLASIGKLWKSQDILSFRNIRRSHIHYFFAFPLAMIFVNSQWYLFDHSFQVFGLPSTTYMFISFAIGANIMLLAASAKNISVLSKISAVITIIGFIPWLFVPDGYLALGCAIIFMAGVGGCVSCSGFSFVFSLNNTERFCGSAFMLFFISFIKSISDFTLLYPIIRTALIFLLVAGMTACAYLTKPQDFSVQELTEKKKNDPGLWLALFVFFSYFVIRIAGFYVPDFQIPFSSLIRGLSSIAAVILCFVIHIGFKRNIWTMCNVFFITSILSYTTGYLSMPAASCVFSGLKEIGLIISFYLIGCVSNKFCNFRSHKLLVIICISSIGVLYIIPDFLIKTPFTQPAAMIVSAVLFMIFFLMAPAFAHYLFNAGWSEDLRKLNMSDAQAVIEHTDKFENLQLYPREKEVAALLLQGLTMRQISAELKIAQSTVNGYCNSLYKKLGINSRVELFARFGVDMVNHESPKPTADIKK